MRTWILVAIALVGCKKKDDDKYSSEEAYVASEIASLEKALAANDETAAGVECMSLNASVKRLPAATVDKIAKLCDVDLARMFMKNAVADVKAKNAEHPDVPELADINCMQLFVEDAFISMARHPTNDPELTQLADEYTKLCPKDAAKAREKAAAKAAKAKQP